MAITIETELDSVKRSIDVITKTAPPSSGNLIFKCKDGKILLISTADLSRCQVILPGTLEGDGEFSIPLQSFRDATAGREKIKLVYKEGALFVSSGRYKTTLSTVDVIPLDDLKNSEDLTKSWKINVDQASWLNDALKKVSLKPTSLFSTWMPAGIQLSDKGAFVSCYDDQHLSWIKDKDIKGDFSCLLPMDVLQSVLEVFHKASFVISQSKSFINVSNKQIDLVLNIPASDDLRSVEEVIEKVKAASKVDGDRIVLRKAEVVSYLANARSVIGKERAEIEIKPVEKDGKKSLNLSIKTTQGTSEVYLKFKGALRAEFKVDHDYFSELVSKSPDEISISVVEGSFLSMDLKETKALVALNQ